MKKLSFTLFLQLLCTFVLYAQQGTLRARITEAGSAKPVELAAVQIETTTIGGITDENGEVVITDIPPGTYNIKISCVGYQPKTVFELEITKGKPAEVVAEISPSSTELTAVEIKANPFVKSDESPLSVRTIGINEIQRYPGGNRDISKVVQALPGVGFSAGFRNDLYIRGGSAAENKFYIDGIEIPNINHFATQGSTGGPNGLINVDFIREVNFYSSAFPANRGNALSSVMDIKLRDGRDDRWGGTFTIGSSDFAASMESPLNKKKTATILASVRYSYLQLLFTALKLPFLPTYTDAQVKVKWKITPKDEFVFLSLSAYDVNKLNTSIKNPDEGQQYLLNVLPEQTQFTYMIGGKYTHYFDNSYLQVFLSRNMLSNKFVKWKNNDRNQQKLTDYASTESENKLRVEYTGRKGRLRYNTGLNYEFARYTNSSVFFDAPFTQQGLVKIDFNTRFNMHKFGAFANVSASMYEDIVTLALGIRFDGNNYNRNMAELWRQTSPRLSVSVKLPQNIRINANAGYYHQLPSYTLLGFKDSTGELTNESTLTYMRNVHAVAGIEYTTPINSRISVEGFFKRYYNVPFMLDNSVSVANQGGNFGVVGNGPAISKSQGKTYGVEFLYEQKLYKGFYGIVSYTLFWSRFTDALNNYLPSSWDTRHIISLTGGKKFKRNWEFGLRWRIQGGTPYTPYDIAASTLFARFNPSQPGILDYNQLNAEQAGWFHSADLRVTKKWYFKKWSFELYLDVQNFYLSKTPQPPTFIPVYEADGVTPQQNPDDPSRFQYMFLNTNRAIPLPTLGVVVYY